MILAARNPHSGLMSATNLDSMNQANGGVEQSIGRAFLAAHLLTASVENAERAVLEAVASWDPRTDEQETLVRRALYASVARPVSDSSESAGTESARSRLPGELQAVFDLSMDLRRCFVLRILAGISAQVCAQWLQLPPRLVNQYTRAALQYLPVCAQQYASAANYFA
jgi:hypothetical protein